MSPHPHRTTSRMRVSVTLARVFARVGLTEYAQLPEPGRMDREYEISRDELERVLQVARSAYLEERAHVKRAIYCFLKQCTPLPAIYTRQTAPGEDAEFQRFLAASLSRAEKSRRVDGENG